LKKLQDIEKLDRRIMILPCWVSSLTFRCVMLKCMASDSFHSESPSWQDAETEASVHLH